MKRSSFAVTSILFICWLAALLMAGCSSAPATSSSTASESVGSAAVYEAASSASAEVSSTEAATEPESASADQAVSESAQASSDQAASESAQASAEQATPESAPDSESAQASADQEASASPSAAEPAPSSESTSVSASADPAREAAQAAMDNGYQVFEGTVRVVDAEQLIALQGVDIDPAAASGGGEYAVLVFDQPIMVSGMSADGTGMTRRSASMMGVAEYTEYSSFVVEYGNLETWRDLDGQHATIAVLADDIMFPSDVRLPIGEPSASAVTLL